MTETQWNIYKEAADFLDLFGCRCDTKGYYYFVELVYAIRAIWRGNVENNLVFGEKGYKSRCLREIICEMCKSHNTFPRAMWGQIHSAVLPVLSSDDCVLQAYGISLKNRTSSELAYALAELLEN